MPECLDSYPWRSIRGCGPLAPAMFKVGDYKNIVLADGTMAMVRIIGFNHDRATSGEPASITWEFVDCLPRRHYWNDRSSNEGSWERTTLRHRMNDPEGSIYQLMPADLLDVVTPVIKLTANTYNGENNIIETEDKFFLKSEKELFGRCFYSLDGEGHWYEWYRQEDVPWGKKRNGDNEYVMLRSPYRFDGDYFCMAGKDGLPDYASADYSDGVAPAFCT